MQLFISEKPKVAAELANALPGPRVKKEGYFEVGEEKIVTWLFSHMLRHAEPEEYDEGYKNWRLEHLPIVPNQWKICVTESCQKQFRIVKGLIARATEIIHAGDPDREGQLLVDAILEFCGNKAPVKRIFLRALDQKSIREALNDMRDNAEYARLSESALGRTRADWLVGINLSRAYTLNAKEAGLEFPFPIGRVKTPTLGLVVRREKEILSFKPVEHFVLKAKFASGKDIFVGINGVWKPAEGQEGIDAAGRLIDPAIASLITEKINTAKKTTGIITQYQTEEKTEPQRLPYSLSSLQIAANKKYGYSPQAVLNAVQTLYERKYSSYPRSDCEYLPDSQHQDAPAILGHLSTWELYSSLVARADTSLRSPVWNTSRCPVHHAIIPTVNPADLPSLSPIEADIYQMIIQSYVAQFFPQHTFLATSGEITFAGETFKIAGKTVAENGWHEVFEVESVKPDEDDENPVQSLPSLEEGDVVSYSTSTCTRKSTRPPSRFSAGSLVLAMKEIHRYLRNQEQTPQRQFSSSIGTEATRAGIIQELIEKGFLRLEKKHLHPTELAKLLIENLPEELTYPDIAAAWETRFDVMEHGEIRLKEFWEDQVKFHQDQCALASKLGLKKFTEEIPECPKCGGTLRLRKGVKGIFWGCSQYPECRQTYPNKNNRPDIR